MNSGASREARIAVGAAALGVRAVTASAGLAARVARGALRLPVIGPVGHRAADRLAAEGGYVIDEILPVAIDRGKRIIVAVISVIVAELDLTTLVREHADLNAIAADLDIEAILDRVDLNAVIAERVNLDAAVGLVDLDAVAGGIDIDAITARIDIDAILGRVDLIGLAEEVIDGVDLTDIIRDASTSVTADVMTDVRGTSERADDAVANTINRILRRRVADGAADGQVPGE